jgi:hypothetical protein
MARHDRLDKIAVLMTRELHPLRVDDLDDLSRFLTVGFHSDSAADFAAPDVLHWKYLEARGELDDLPRSYLARDEASQVIGHVGLCRTFWEGTAITEGRISTLHMIDWLGSTAHRAVGASLMRKAHETASTQFGLGGSEAGRTVIKRGGYQPRQPVCVYQSILRPSYLFRMPGLRGIERTWRLGREITRKAAHPARTSRRRIELRQVSQFGSEIDTVVEEARAHSILTSRTHQRLNHMLRFPRQSMSGWLLQMSSDRVCGFAILNIVPHHCGGIRLGKIVDCVLTSDEVDIWHASLLALKRELDHQRADIAQCFGSTPWICEGLDRAGFVSRFSLEFSLRDRSSLIPQGIPFHLMPIEADYAYT